MTAALLVLGALALVVLLAIFGELGRIARAIEYAADTTRSHDDLRRRRERDRGHR